VIASSYICALILSETLALYKSFTYLLTYLLLIHCTVHTKCSDAFFAGDDELLDRSLYTVNQFGEEEYVDCTDGETLLTYRYSYRDRTHYMFDDMLDCSFSPTTLRQRCAYVSPHFLVSICTCLPVAGVTVTCRTRDPEVAGSTPSRGTAG